MVIKESKYGKFLACPNYPKCKNIKSLDEPVGFCPLCGAPVYKRRSKAGKVFYGCSNYPECKFMSWDVPEKVGCPTCGSEMRVQKTGGERYFVCTNDNCGVSVPYKDMVLAGNKKSGTERVVPADGSEK